MRVSFKVSTKIKVDKTRILTPIKAEKLVSFLRLLNLAKL